MTEHPEHKELDYNYSTDGIYIGTNVCCRVHFDERLANEGIEADISLEASHVDMPFGVDAYLWLPVVDHTAPNEEQLEIGVAMIKTLAKLKKKVYIHCKNGHGRAPTLVAAYVIEQGKSPEEAIALLKEKRTSVHLRDAQVSALQAYAKHTT